MIIMITIVIILLAYIAQISMEYFYLHITMYTEKIFPVEMGCSFHGLVDAILLKTSLTQRGLRAGLESCKL